MNQFIYPPELDGDYEMYVQFKFDLILYLLISGLQRISENVQKFGLYHFERQKKILHKINNTILSGRYGIKRFIHGKFILVGTLESYFFIFW